MSLIAFIKRKKFFFLLGLILCAVIIVRFLILQEPSGEIFYTVKKENLVDTVQVSGTYTTASQVTVSSSSNGVISQLFVTNGSVVKKDDPLFHVDSTATTDQQKAAYANYLAASAAMQADNATLYSLQSSMYSTWKKYTDLSTNSTYQNSDGSPNETNRVLPEFTTAQDNWLAAEAQYKDQQSVIAKDQAALASAKQTYDETQSITVTAPTGGTVVNLLANVGDQVSAPSQAADNPILVIANLNDPYLSADISEDYAARIAIGQKVDIVFDALKEQTFHGTVTAIATVGTNAQGVITYPARITARDIPTTIKPNMTALMTIETLRKNNVLDVPNSALIVKNGKTYVELAGSHALTNVQIGVRGITKAEITSGLQSGITILANPN